MDMVLFFFAGLGVSDAVEPLFTSAAVLRSALTMLLIPAGIKGMDNGQECSEMHPETRVRGYTQNGCKMG